MFRHLIVVSAALLATTPAGAQSGAFNMGQLTGTVSQDAVTQSEARRGAVRGKTAKGGGGRMKALCAQRFSYRAAERASEDGRAVERMCRAEGY